MDFETITLRKQNGIGIITLNRPEVLNAMSEKMADELLQAIGEVSRDEEIRALVLTGAGQAFCAGADFRFGKVRIGEVAAVEAEDMQRLHDEWRRGHLLHRGSQLFLGLQRLPKPTIACVNGDAVGGGFDLALSCDIRIGSPKARFITGFPRVGLAHDTGGTWLLPRIIGLGKALEYILTGDPCPAEEAYRIGLLNKLVPEDELEGETMALARKLAQGPPIALRLSKLQVYKGLEMDMETALALATSCVLITFSSEDYKEGIKAFAERKRPVFKGR